MRVKYLAGKIAGNFRPGVGGGKIAVAFGNGRAGPGAGPGPEDRAGPRERREHGPAPDLAGLDRQRGRRTTPDPPGLLRLERDTDPPGLHKPDPDPHPDRGPPLVALRRRLKTASQDAHAGPAKEPDLDPARRAEGGFMRAV